MNVLSIQSHVSFGHVGNSVAVFLLQRLNCEVWPVHTVHFSNHTGYPDWTGTAASAAQVSDLIDGLDARGALADCDAVLTGYVGSAELGAVIAKTVRRVKRANPKAVYCCDPVMGDAGRGFYVKPGVPEFMADEALPLSDILTPNPFELAALAGAEPGDLIGGLDALVRAAQGLLLHGPNTVLITSVEEYADDSRAPARIGMAAVTRDGCWLATTPRLSFEIAPNGAGDATAALFLAHHATAPSTAQALEATLASVHALLAETQRRGGRELALIESQDAVVSPSVTERARRLDSAG